MSKKVILITGASRGIGAFTANVLAQQGHSIIINYARHDEEANKVVNKILASGGSASAFKANIAHSNEVKALFEYVIQTYGRLDVLINNAGIMALSKIEHVEDDSINQLLDVNLKGSLYTMRPCVRLPNI